MDIELFGKFIANRRKELGMTQKSLAEKLNITPKAVSRWERCAGYPDIEILQDLANALGISMDSLFACNIKADSLKDEQVLQIVRDSVEIDRKNNQIQEKAVNGLIICVTLLTGILFYLAGYGNIGGSLFFGLISSGFVVSVYYLLVEGKNSNRKIYIIISAAFLAVIIGLLYMVIR